MQMDSFRFAIPQQRAFVSHHAIGRLCAHRRFHDSIQFRQLLDACSKFPPRTDVDRRECAVGLLLRILRFVMPGSHVHVCWTIRK